MSFFPGGVVYFQSGAHVVSRAGGGFGSGSAVGTLRWSRDPQGVCLSLPAVPCHSLFQPFVDHCSLISSHFLQISFMHGKEEDLKIIF